MQKCKKQKHRKQKRRKEENIMRKTWKTAGSMLMAVALLTASLSGCGTSNETGETKTSESASAETESQVQRLPRRTRQRLPAFLQMPARKKM